MQFYKSHHHSSFNKKKVLQKCYRDLN